MGAGLLLGSHILRACPDMATFAALLEAFESDPPTLPALEATLSRFALVVPAVGSTLQASKAPPKISAAHKLLKGIPGKLLAGGPLSIGHTSNEEHPSWRSSTSLGPLKLLRELRAASEKNGVQPDFPSTFSAAMKTRKWIVHSNYDFAAQRKQDRTYEVLLSWPDSQNLRSHIVQQWEEYEASVSTTPSSVASSSNTSNAGSSATSPSFVVGLPSFSHAPLIATSDFAKPSASHNIRTRAFSPSITTYTHLNDLGAEKKQRLLTFIAAFVVNSPHQATLPEIVHAVLKGLGIGFCQTFLKEVQAEMFEPVGKKLDEERVGESLSKRAKTTGLGGNVVQFASSRLKEEYRKLGEDNVDTFENAVACEAFKACVGLQTLVRVNGRDQWIELLQPGGVDTFVEAVALMEGGKAAILTTGCCNSNGENKHICPFSYSRDSTEPTRKLVGTPIYGFPSHFSEDLVYNRSGDVVRANYCTMCAVWNYFCFKMDWSFGDYLATRAHQGSKSTHICSPLHVLSAAYCNRCLFPVLGDFNGHSDRLYIYSSACHGCKGRVLPADFKKALENNEDLLEADPNTSRDGFISLQSLDGGETAPIQCRIDGCINFVLSVGLGGTVVVKMIGNKLCCPAHFAEGRKYFPQPLLSVIKAATKDLVKLSQREHKNFNLAVLLSRHCLSREGIWHSPTTLLRFMRKYVSSKKAVEELGFPDEFERFLNELDDLESTSSPPQQPT
ncbi:hypothetical protein BDY24DRAFT_417277 [Mrakia frigida]|uniref:uncharacterized protein n=1 Tax=Mrakia frigida TaxID=29902 RepID=UPI003FCC0664